MATGLEPTGSVPEWKPDVDSTHIGDELVMATSAQVQQLYIALLGRAADKPGLDWWLENINGGERTLEQAAAAFTTSEEFVSTYGSLQGAELVTAVYSNLFERTPSQEEVTYWVNDGRPADQLLAAFLTYASPADQTVINNKVTVAQYYTEAAGSDIDLDAAAKIVADVNGTAASVSAALNNLPTSTATLTAALATLKADTAAVTSFLKALDLDGDGKADNAGATQVADNRAELTKVAASGTGAYDVALNAVDDIVAANSTNNDDAWYSLTAAQQDAELAKVKVNLAADLTNAQTDVDTAYAAMSAALKTAVTKYEAAQTSQQAAVKAEAKADVDLAAAVAKYNVDVGSTAITFDPTATDSTAAAAVTAFGSLITIDPAKYTASLAAGVTETSKPGVTAVLNALQADLTAEKALATANANLATAQTGLDAADGTADDTASSDLGETGSTAPFVLATDAPTYNAYLGLKSTLTNVQNDIKALNDAVASLDAIEVQAAALKELDDAVTDAVSAIGAAGYDLNNADGLLDLNGDGDYTDVGEFDFSAGSDADEAELYTATYSGGSVTMEKGDMVFVGGFAFNNGAAATAGDNGVLEFFVEEGVGANAGNLVVTFEESVFGSNAATPEVNEIVMTGLSMDDVVIGSNFITLA